MSFEEQKSLQPAWRRSGRCVGNGHCVEVADLGDRVALRNSQRVEISLVIGKDAFRGLIASLKA